jgi:hypothetical protein
MDIANKHYVSAFSRALLLTAAFVSLCYVAENAPKLKRSYDNFLAGAQAKISQVYSIPR